VSDTPISPLLQRPPPTMPAPGIPVVDQTNKGGLGYDELRKPPIECVKVTAPLVPNAIKPNDTLVLYWGDVLVDSYLISEEQIRTGVLVFNVAPSRILDGLNVEVRYHSFSALAGNEAVSNSYFVNVDTEVPGDPDPVPLTPTLNENLAKPNGIPLIIDDAVANQGVTVTIVPWLFMEEGDVLTLTWGQTQLKQPPLTAVQVNKPVVIPVSAATILATPNTLGLQVFYDIRDVVGNWSLHSLPALTDIEAGPNTLPAPRIEKAVGDNDLDLAELGTSDANVYIPSYLGWSIGDLVVLHWLGVTSGGLPVDDSVSYVMLPEDEGFPARLQIKNSTVVAIAGGRALVYYEVNGLRRSRRVAITVSGQVQPLPAPSVREQVGGVIDPEAVAGAGATVIVQAYPGMASTHRIVLYWNGVTAAGGNTQHTEEKSGNNQAQDITFKVPKAAHVDGLAGGTVDAYYTVVSGAVSRDSVHVSLSVKAASPGFDLIKPSVPKALGDGSRLNFDTAMYEDEYLSVIVNYRGMAAGQKVQLHWAGSVVYQSEIKTVSVVGNLEFRVPRMEVVDVIGRSANITYTVTLANGTGVGTSAALVLSVDPQAYDLIAPVISADNSIVTLQYPGMNVPHTGRVRWQGVVKHDTQEQNLDTRPEQFRIPLSWVTENRGREVLINYSVYRGDGRHFMFSRVLRKQL
jgi:hypothetical protein